jgi:hypothetical protein
MKHQRGTYTTTWDSGIEITTNCTFAVSDDGCIFVESDEVVEVEGLEVLEGEQVEFPDGTVYSSEEWEFDYNLPR